MKSSHIYVGRFPEEKQERVSSLAVASAPPSHTAHMWAWFLWSVGSQGKSHRDKKRDRKNKTKNKTKHHHCGGTCTLFSPVSWSRKQDLVNLRTLGIYSDLAPVVPGKYNVCSEICRTGCRCDTRHTGHIPSSPGTEQGRQAHGPERKSWQAGCLPIRSSLSFTRKS